jgi:hypothetical protein
MLDDERHVQPAQTDCTVHVEEVCGQESVGVGAKERAPGVVPGVRWWDAAGAKDLADGDRADAMPESAKLALDTDHTPGFVSRASRTISSTSSGFSGGRPGAFGWVHFLATSRRCQRISVPGATMR